MRACIVAIAVWVALMASYAFVLRELLPFPGWLVAAAIAGSVVWFGLATAYGARTSWRDWSAQQRMARGERPDNGDTVCAIGPIRPLLQPLHAPFSGRECVIYSYKAGVPQNSGNRETAARDYVGFGFTRCSVHTPYGTFALGTFPVLEGFADELGDDATGAAYMRTTHFDEVPGLTNMLKAMLGVYRKPPPLRIDWRVGTPQADPDTSERVEQVVLAGETVTAIGQFASGSGEIIGGSGTYLRLLRGGTPRAAPAWPFSAIAKLFSGLAIAAAANAALWWLLGAIAR